MKKIIAVDCDGTLWENEFPKVGKMKQDIIDKVNKLKDSGAYIILWTCREGKELEEVKQICKDNNIQYDKINENAPWIKGFGHPKIYADAYVDDKAINVWDFVKISNNELLGENKNRGGSMSSKLKEAINKAKKISESSDSDNINYAFQTFGTKLLLDIALGRVDAKKAAMKELDDRMVDKNGKFVGSKVKIWNV